MWHCANCIAEIADKYAYCWQCGTKRVFQPEPKAERTQQPPAPAFASYEELVREPPSRRWVFRRGLLMRLCWYVLLVVIFKVATSRFLGTYGIHIFVAVAIVALVVILWRFFHRDQSEGVGLKLD